MTWLGDLLRHLNISKGFVTAVFVTSLVLIGGPFIAPNWFDPVPSEWRWMVSAAGVFTFMLIVLWLVPLIFQLLISTPRRIRNSPRWNPPTEEERAFIFLLGKISPNDTLDLDLLNNPPMSKLELLALCSSLDKKGLLIVNEYDDNLVSLTAMGRIYALRLSKKIQT